MSFAFCADFRVILKMIIYLQTDLSGGRKEKKGNSWSRNIFIHTLTSPQLFSTSCYMLDCLTAECKERKGHILPSKYLWHSSGNRHRNNYNRVIRALRKVEKGMLGPEKL